MDLLSGFMIGLLGSFHCIGMCGPIVLSLPPSKPDAMSVIIHNALYNFGRVLAYMLLGLIAGFIGHSISLAGFQEVLSVSLGGLILISVVAPEKLKASFRNFYLVSAISVKFRSFFGKRLSAATNSSMLVIGILNGFLPCGLVYVALANAAVSVSAFGSVAVMAAFGLGTIPMMAAAFFLKRVITPNLRRKINKMIPIGVALIGVLLILRGLSLGIPYISPILPDAAGGAVQCHH